MSYAQPAFFLHRVALVVQVRLVHRQRTHAVGFQEQAEIELIGREGFEIIRAILRGGAVHVAAVVFHQDHVLALADVRRAFEHHVLEQVREAGMARPLVVRADVIGNGNPVSGRGMIHGHYDAEPVIQLVLFNRNPQRFRRGLGFQQPVRRRNKHQTGQEHRKNGYAHMCTLFYPHLLYVPERQLLI